MNIVKTPKGDVALANEQALALESVQDFLDMIANAGARTVAVGKGQFPEAFFDLKTGLAGEMLQKVSTYGYRLIIIGDFSHIESKSLRDFIRESNDTGQVVFTESLESGIGLL